MSEQSKEAPKAYTHKFVFALNKMENEANDKLEKAHRLMVEGKEILKQVQFLKGELGSSLQEYERWEKKQDERNQ